MSQSYRIEERQGDAVSWTITWADEFPNLLAALMFFNSMKNSRVWSVDYRPHTARRLVLLAVESYPAKHRRRGADETGAS